MTEDDFQRSVIELAQAMGFRVAHFRPVRQQRADGTTRYLTPVQADGTGFPDLIMLRGSRGIAWELKSKMGRVSAEQCIWIDAFKAVGFDSGILYPSDWDYIEKELTRD